MALVNIIPTTTLVDDLTSLIDGASLTGSQNSPIANFRIKTKTPAPVLKPRVQIGAGIINNTLIDDTLALVDDSSALAGSQNTPVVDFKIKIKYKR